MTRLLSPDALTLDPAPVSTEGVSLARARARALRAWARAQACGEQPGITVTYRGKPVAPERVRWADVDTGSGSSGGAGGNPHVALRLPPDDAAALDRLTAAWRCDRSAAVRRAVREADARTAAEKP